MARSSIASLDRRRAESHAAAEYRAGWFTHTFHTLLMSVCAEGVSLCPEVCAGFKHRTWGAVPSDGETADATPLMNGSALN